MLTSDLHHPIDEAEGTALPTRLVGTLARARSNPPDGSTAVKVQINTDRCQGHGRCYDLVPELFGEDDHGYGTVLDGGLVPPDLEAKARLAAANCPEQAIELLSEA